MMEFFTLDCDMPAYCFGSALAFALFQSGNNGFMFGHRLF